MRYFVFNGIDSRDHGYVLELERDILPPLNPVLMKIPRRAGGYIPEKHSREIESLSFKVKLGLIGSNNADLRAKAREIANWLFNANHEGKAQSIYFSDEPSRLYYVHVSSGVNIEEVAATGEIEIEFLAVDPFASATYVNTSTFTVTGENLIPVTTFDDIIANFSDWYGNLTFWQRTTNGEDTMRVMLTNHGVNPRIRVLTHFENMADLVAGETYTLSYVILNQSPELTRLELLGMYYFDAGVWQDFNARNLADLPYYDEAEGSRLYTETFVAAYTGRARVAFGFGLGNATQDGSEFMVKNIKLEKGAEYTAFKHGSTDPARYVKQTYAGTYKTYPDFKITPLTTLNYLRISKKGKHIYINRTLEAWQAVIVNNRTNEIYLEDSGISLLPYTTISSRFFELEPDKTDEITIRSSSSSFSALMNWTNKYL